MMLDRPQEMVQTSLFDLDEKSGSEASYLLTQLEVYNWGPFGGLHRAEFDPAGTAIIGPTGSGKTTLVDALMTLLVAQPRYNLASTGGHESDRTLISYVRGVLGGDGSDGREEVSRPGKTITGICATYQNGEQTVKLGALLWTEGSGNGAEDLKRRWVFSSAEGQTLDVWLRMLHEDGIRDLLKMGRETANLRIFDSKKAYLTHIRKFFDVGENAFTLLNRAAGLKQLNSIDEIFRELVLDDRSAFDRAIEVAGEFDNLAAIHAELETAKKQEESLRPVKEEHERLQKSQRKEERYRTLKRVLPIWFATVAHKRWEEEGVRLAQQSKLLQEQYNDLEEKMFEVRLRVDDLRERYLSLGGNVIGEIENTIASRKETVALKRTYANQYQTMIRRFQLSDDLKEPTFRTNQESLREKRGSVQESHDEQSTATLSLLSEVRDQETKIQELELALRKVKERPGSNIPHPFQDFRSDLATELGLNDSDLPFLAELIEVKGSETRWRGAIERAIGSERLRVLVPEDLIDEALRWVNHRDNRLHVRLQEAKTTPFQEDFFQDGYVNKLNFKQHPLQGAAKRLLAGRDLHCVDSAEVLKRTEFALTVQGMTSGKKGKFEKQDQRRLDQDWMTGFDNKDQLESIAREVLTSRELLGRLQTHAKESRQKLDHWSEQLQLIDTLLQLEFASIDLPRAEADLTHSEERLAALLDPKSNASHAKQEYDRMKQQLDSIQQRLNDRQSEISIIESKRKDAEAAREDAIERIGDGMTPEELELANTNLTIDVNVQPNKLISLEREMAKRVDERYTQHQDKIAEIKQQLVRKMEAAKRFDTGALAEVGSDVSDVQHYLDRLNVLTLEALPEKRARFLDYLNRSSDQGVTQLLASIDEEVDAIELRIQELNLTLVKVDFRSGRYLQLMPQRMKDERLRSLDAVMRKVRSAALKDDGGESHYKALQEMVAILRDAGENRRLQGSKALLDPRFRLQFFVVEVDRQTGDQSPPRTGSQSGSGGEKELMASHILTASLSYALCPPAASHPLYGTVILDEAFSKSSPSAASRIIEALRIFCLHPIFVTPNKEVGLLKQHTRKVICVQRPGKEASLASISWERLEAIAKGQ